MKARNLFKGIIGLLLLSLIVAGCKKEDVPPEFQQISLDTEEIMTKLPSGLTNSNDQYAEECVGMIEDALDMSSFLENMEVPDYAEKSSKKSSGDTWTWTWAYGGQSFTILWTYDEDNTKRYWTMEVSFDGGPSYDYISAWEMKDGSEGEIVYTFNWLIRYDDSSMEDFEEVYWKYTWRLDSAGNYYFSWYYDSSDPDYDYYLRYDVVIYANGSGEVDYYFFDDLYYHMEWDATGAGLWNYYIMGGTEMSGTWPAA